MSEVRIRMDQKIETSRCYRILWTSPMAQGTKHQYGRTRWAAATWAHLSTSDQMHSNIIGTRKKTWQKSSRSWKHPSFIKFPKNSALLTSNENLWLLTILTILTFQLLKISTAPRRMVLPEPAGGAGSTWASHVWRILSADHVAQGMSPRLEFDSVVQSSEYHALERKWSKCTQIHWSQTDHTIHPSERNSSWNVDTL